MDEVLLEKKADEVESLQSKFTEFLKTFKDVDGRFKYEERIKQMIIDRKRSVTVEYEDIARYDPKLLELLINKPDQTFYAFSEAIKGVVSDIDEEYASEVERFIPRLNGLPLVETIRNLRSEHINKLIMIEGIIVRATPPKQKLFKATYAHVLPTGEVHEFEWPLEPGEEVGDELERPSYCPICVRDEIFNERSRSSGRGTFRLIVERSKYRNWQKIVVQERPEEVPAGHIPRSVEVILSDDIVDTVRPGDRVSVVGVVKLMKEPRRRVSQSVFNMYIEANNVIVAQRFLEEVRLSREDEDLIKRLGRDPLVRRKIIASIAPTIYGLWDIKEAIALLLFGGVPKVAPDGTKVRGDIHVLLVGDPGTAKSQLLQYVARIAPRGIYTTGKGSSAAGLTAAVVKDKQSGEYFLEAGAMVLADGGVVCIDEIDKMREEDRVAIHEAMEQGTVSIAKAGIVARLNARASVLAAGNPKYGRYIASRPISENINLPITILSRFDLIFTLRDVANTERDRSLVRYVLGSHERVESVEPEIPPDVLRKYIAYARKFVKPRLTKEAELLIEEFYLEMRRKSAEAPEAPIAITTRQLEALIRLAEAHAKMALKNYVEAEDVAEAIRLMNVMLENVGIDIETGHIDIDVIMTGKPKSVRDKEIVVKDIIKELSSEAGCAKIREIVREAKQRGIDENFVEKYITNLRKVGELYEVKPGCVDFVE